MLHGLRKAAWMLAVIPLSGLALTGCGGGGGGSDSATPTAGLRQETVVPQETQTAASTARYDINILMVCDAVESAMDEIGGEAPAKQYRTALRKSLNSAFRSSTTPEATIADVRVDRLLNQGCPGERARALVAADIYEFADLA